MDPQSEQGLLARLEPCLKRVSEVGRGSASFRSNKLKTSKYEWYNFLPFNLLEQMRTPSNIYFFVASGHQVIGLLQMAPSISPTDQYPLIYIPLLFVLVLNALRDSIEEAKRKKKDLEINHRPANVYQSSGAFAQRFQQDLQVGDIVQVKKNEAFPADLVLLSSSDKGRRR